MGGVIGLLADDVGKKLGKKRLSIGGLRPKHTARLGTFLLGFVISMFTQLSVLTFSSGVREWVLKGPQVAAKLQQANEQAGFFGTPKSPQKFFPPRLFQKSSPVPPSATWTTPKI